MKRPAQPLPISAVEAITAHIREPEPLAVQVCCHLIQRRNLTVLVESLRTSCSKVDHWQTTLQQIKLRSNFGCNPHLPTFWQVTYRHISLIPVTPFRIQIKPGSALRFRAIQPAVMWWLIGEQAVLQMPQLRDRSL